MPQRQPMEGADALEGLNPADLLKQGAAADTLPGKRIAFAPPSLEELARIFPQFEILELIGTGGMGAVYKVRQRELDRLAALKILPPAIGEQAGFAARFTREAKALAKLDHPGIVTVYESGQAQGLYYFLMEYVDGVNLGQLQSNGRISAREAMAIVPQICDALQFAHDHGIVHRDIKPENLLLDRRGRVKVADFGIAKMIGAAGPDAEQERLGTPAYMAPEQIEHPAEVDHRADIFALGVVFYQMLTGELPGKHLELPSRKVRVDVRLDEVVLRALEKSPDLRYQQAGEVRTRVEEIASSVSSPARASAPMRTRPMILALSIGAAIPIAFFIGYLGLVFSPRLPPNFEPVAYQQEGASPRPAAIDGRLPAARAAYQRRKIEFEAGLIDQMKLDEAEDRVALLEAEARGKAEDVARVRLSAALRHEKRARLRSEAGLSSPAELEAAEAEVEALRHDVNQGAAPERINH